ncbi:zn cluster transcription factor [Niveomyces insectorum RCEF 264]|uniref:Zn cluster transcription factor n=1 Tax=Niveomyces insectorum RCEF 264 TaxID=1081102 RepID=A0A167NRK1_9HYPO|nr:zn cluster transcription factor [Niveomyces insectorum RCEF 264]
MEKDLSHRTASRMAPVAGDGEGNGDTKTDAYGERAHDESGHAEHGHDPSYNGTKNGHGPKAKAAATIASSDTHSDAAHTPKKRRKVNHACVYCRRSHMTCDLERPCTRCIKRNIGHLCHDEPRESEAKKSKSGHDASIADDSDDFTDARTSFDQKSTATAAPANVALQPPPPPPPPPSFDADRDAAKSAFDARMLGQTNPLQLVRPSPVSAMQPNVMAMNDVNQYMHNHPSYMIVPEVSGELQFLNEFLQNSMVDDAAYVSDDQNNQLLRNASLDAAATHDFGGSSAGDNRTDGTGTQNDDRNVLLPSSAVASSGAMLPPVGGGGGGSAGATGTVDRSTTPTRPATATAPASASATAAGSTGTAAVIDKARAYYLQAADPSGNDTPEQRMSDLLKAKYDAGLLKPFNYVKGYARLHTYLDSHTIAPASKQRIQRQLDRFRPKFREKTQALTDLELIYVEMWFEKTLMEYDRVFASMAVPACCWRRTGEIVRGNKEMAELIHVPVESLRDGKIALHEILTEESMVRYWEEFGTIAFDSAHDTLLTACSLKNPDDKANDPIVKCCFSLKIRRDDHKIPTLVVGNFLPHDPLTH